MPRAMICRELGAPEVLRLESFEVKPLAAGQVRVAVRAAGLNYPDVLMVAGDYQHKPPLPFIPGMEAAGDVVEVGGNVANVRVGDRVIVKSRGVLTEEIVVTPSMLAPMPKNFDYAQGATFLAAHGTAYYGLVDRAQIKPGETLLVHGAAGGVGLAAVELGKVYGATVIAVASTQEKLAIARQRGADHTLLAGQPFRDKVKELTGRQGRRRGVRSRRGRCVRGKRPLHQLGRAADHRRLPCRRRRGADQPRADQECDRAWHPCRRSPCGATRRSARRDSAT